MGEYKTPGVYIKEKCAFGNSVVEAETAIPAFIGITEKAENGNDNLTNVPWKISSMSEFVKYFGSAPELKFEVDIKKFFYLSEEQKRNNIKLKQETEKVKTNVFKHCTYPKDEKGTATDNKGNPLPDTPIGYALCVDGQYPYTLYYNLLMFFANGGSTCYIVSVGTYDYEKYTTINKAKVETALNALEKEREVTMIVVPEAVNSSECANIQQLMMKHCGEMANRFGILDIPSGSENDALDKRTEMFQDTVTGYFSYGAAYFPWLNTSVLGDRDLTGGMFAWSANACAWIEKFADPALAEIVKAFFGKIESEEDKQTFHQALVSSSFLYQQAIKAVLKQLNLLPPSATMAGIYTMVDRTRGVWKAPANVTLNYVNSPAEDIDDDKQVKLNAPMNGKAINAIRSFRGEGVKVWGARTLDGNSLDWRYINVRRTLLFLEETVRNAARAYVFEPNDAGTWVNMKCMIENFLRSVWKRGGLAGATPEDAFEVHVGLGDTMTAEDIQAGIMRITVLIAVTHPAEFIEITFQQQMQKS